jgi:hypothetical protein
MQDCNATQSCLSKPTTVTYIENFLATGSKKWFKLDCVETRELLLLVLSRERERERERAREPLSLHVVLWKGDGAAPPFAQIRVNQGVKILFIDAAVRILHQCTVDSLERAHTFSCV